MIAVAQQRGPRSALAKKLGVPGMPLCAFSVPRSAMELIKRSAIAYQSKSSIHFILNGVDITPGGASLLPDDEDDDEFMGPAAPSGRHVGATQPEPVVDPETALLLAHKAELEEQVRRYKDMLVDQRQMLHVLSVEVTALQNRRDDELKRVDTEVEEAIGHADRVRKMLRRRTTKDLNNAFDLEDRVMAQRLAQTTSLADHTATTNQVKASITGLLQKQATFADKAEAARKFLDTLLNSNLGAAGVSALALTFGEKLKGLTGRNVSSDEMLMMFYTNTQALGHRIQELRAICAAQEACPETQSVTITLDVLVGQLPPEVLVQYVADRLAARAAPEARATASRR